MVVYVVVVFWLDTEKRIYLIFLTTLPPQKAHQNLKPFIYQTFSLLKKYMIKQNILYTWS
jgi:hypothetical protein